MFAASFVMKLMVARPHDVSCMDARQFGQDGCCCIAASPMLTTSLTSDASCQDKTLSVLHASRFTVGDTLAIWDHEHHNSEHRSVVGIDETSNTIRLSSGMLHAYSAENTTIFKYDHLDPCRDCVSHPNGISGQKVPYGCFTSEAHKACVSEDEQIFL